MILSWSICVAANGMISFCFLAERQSIEYMQHISFLHSFVDGHYGCFHVLAVVNSAAVNVVGAGGACILLDHVFSPDIC